MNKKFILNLALLFFLNLLIKPFWIFGIDRTVQNTVGVNEYGFYFALFNFSVILNMLLDLGIVNFNNRNIAQNSHLLNKYFSNIVVLKFLLGVIYFVVSIALAFLLGYSSKQIILLLFLVFNQFLLSFILYLRSNLSGLQLFKTDSLISVLDRTIMIIICSLLLWGNITDTTFKIKWFVFAQTAAYLLTASITFFIVLWHSGTIKIKFDFPFLLSILKKSYPFAILGFLMGFYNRIDSVFLERFASSEQAGIYAQAYRILDAASMLSLLFAGLLLPMFSKMIKEKTELNQLIKLSFILIIIPAIIIATSSFFYRKEVINLLYHSHIDNSANIFSILMISFVFVAINYIFGTLLTANGSLKQLNIIALMSLVLNFALNLILIPKYKALGAAYANVATQFFATSLQIVVAFRIFRLPLNLKLLLLLISFTLLSVFIGFISYQLPYDWKINISIMLFCSFLFAFVIRLLDIKKMYLMIKENN